MQKPFLPPEIYTVLSDDKQKKVEIHLTTESSPLLIPCSLISDHILSNCLAKVISQSGRGRLQVNLFLDKPSTHCYERSVVGSISSSIMLVIIFISCLTFIISSDPSVRHRPDSCEKPACDDDPNLCPNTIICETVPPQWLSLIDTACVIFFTTDYLIRIFLAPFVPARFGPLLLVLLTLLIRLCGVLDTAKWDSLHPEDDYPDPDYSIISQFLLYTTQVMNLIDLAAILPLYINLAITPSSFIRPSASPSSFTIIRLLRMARITRIFKIIRERQDFKVLTDTLRLSLPILTMLFYYTLLGTVVVAAVLFQFEQGEFRVTSAYPEGAYLRPSLTTHEGWEVSPFTSIWAALYWAVITATTLGYGDLYPTTPIGRLISCIWIFCGIVIVAMPIGILGSQFSSTYEAYKEREAKVKKLNEESASLDSPSTSRRFSAQRRNPLRFFPKLQRKYLKKNIKICPIEAQSPHSCDSSPPLLLNTSAANVAGESKGDDEKSAMISSEDEEIVIRRQTLRDLFDLVKQLNQNKSEGSVIERKISEITLVLKHQEERGSSRR